MNVYNIGTNGPVWLEATNQSSTQYANKGSKSNNTLDADLANQKNKNSRTWFKKIQVIAQYALG